MRAENINAAIERYASWERPWDFFGSVSADGSLDDADRSEFQKVWSAACEPQLWTTCTFPECLVLCEAHLAERFGWLSTHARKQIVNGAAYQWR
jgi:hypothetical protein